MSRTASSPLDETAHITLGNGDQAVRQGVDTSSTANGTAASVTMSQPRRSEMETDISASQKMLSAVSGSLLTSLLGMSPFLKQQESLAYLTQLLHSTSSECASNRSQTALLLDPTVFLHLSQISLPISASLHAVAKSSGSTTLLPIVWLPPPTPSVP